ncbi:MAG TPA: ATPase P, partial [Prevotella sp.]|nr:ATPase P [Prevotella sp.]
VNMRWLNIGDLAQTNQICLLMAFANMFFCGRTFYVNSVRQILHGVANMDTLVALSTSISFIFSFWNTFWGDPSLTYFDSCSMVISFVLLGRLLEEKAKDSTTSSIRNLMGIAPKTAHVVEEGKLQEVPVSTIDVGDILEVRPGERVPVDGEVISATSFMTADAAYVDESMITGEPTPVEKKAKSKVLAGTIPSQGVFRMRARQVGEHTALAHIIRIVQEAESSKAPVQRVVDKAVVYFVPIVLALALITFLLWIGLGGMSLLYEAIVSAVTVLVIACPCAMGLATPTALMVGIGKAASKHLLIKDAAALETMRKVDVLVTDKTGTLTIPNKNVDFTIVDSLSFEERETLKPHAADAMRKLSQSGIDVYMMSGDNESAASYWAEKACIAHFKAQCKPQDKEELVRKLKADGKTVAMIGDGINDTQALAIADVSIAISTGTDVAMDVAQVTLMTDDLSVLPFGFQLSKRTTRMIWENLFWAFVYNIVCIPLAAGVLYLFYDNPPFQLTPMWGSALMAFSSISVVLNSLRLKFSA